MAVLKMRSIGVALLAISLAAPAFAQKLSLAERVSRLEAADASQSSSAGQANVELLNRVTQMQSEVQALRNQVEQLQNENAQLKQQTRDQFIDLDGRLQRMETSGAAAGSAPSLPASSASNPPPRTAPATGSRLPATGTRPPSPNAVDLDARALNGQGAYDIALGALRQGDYVESARSFQAFLADYPNAPLAPNAWYWLGESYYATQNYPIALRSFDTLLSNFPDSPKAPDAMLKKGYCQIEMGDAGAGRQTLNRVINEFPGSDAARLATSRLRALSLDPR
jgi:tol-pal system protein YbgF